MSTTAKKVLATACVCGSIGCHAGPATPAGPSLGAGAGGELQVLAEVPPAHWQALARCRVLFGHQSVGDAVVQQMGAWLAARPEIGLRVRRLEDDPEAIGQPGLVHFHVGTNQQPASKIEAFRAILDNGAAARLDVALFKFCYVDLTREEHVVQLFAHYRHTMDELTVRYPHLNFLHVTMPLEAEPTGWRRTLRVAVGESGSARANRARHHYNALLRDAFAPWTIFDLAALEASPAGAGSSQGPTRRAQVLPGLAPSYTADGGHLNAPGARRVAAALFGQLAALCYERELLARRDADALIPKAVGQGQ